MMEQQVVSFRVGTQWYALALETILEIIPLVTLHEAPSVNPDVVGLLQLRNTLIPVVDLRLRFGIADPDYRIDLPIIAKQSAEGPVGFLVDDVDNVERITDEEMLTNLGEKVPYVTSAAKLGDRLLLLVDLTLA